jgi:hypothetical protein
MHSLESAVCASIDCLNPIFSGGVFPELLFNHFMLIPFITICSRVKERNNVSKE